MADPRPSLEEIRAYLEAWAEALEDGATQFDPKRLAKALRDLLAVLPPRGSTAEAIDSDSNNCPDTGERRCSLCSGEWCLQHMELPCDCDVVERHTPFDPGANR
jgi:hypothetical protein